MNAKIDIKTPAGKSLEGFPQTHELVIVNNVHSILHKLWMNMDLDFNVDCHPGDTITIEIL